MNPFQPPDQELLQVFYFLGQFVGRALMDKRILDLPFSVPFLKLIQGTPLQADDIKLIRYVSEIKIISRSGIN